MLLFSKSLPSHTYMKPRRHPSPSPPPNLSLYRLRRLLWVYLLSVLVETNSRRWCAVPTTFTRPNTVQTQLIRVIHSKLLIFVTFFWGGGPFLFFSCFPAFCREGEGEGGLPNNFAVDGAGYAVLQLEIHLGNCVFGEDGSIRDIT